MYKKVFQLTLLVGCIQGSTSQAALDEKACKDACEADFVKNAPSADEDYRSRNEYIEMERYCEYECEDDAKAAPRARTLNSKPKSLKPKTTTPAPTQRK